jgi:hypothetical protein
MNVILRPTEITVAVCLLFYIFPNLYRQKPQQPQQPQQQERLRRYQVDCATSDDGG